MIITEAVKAKRLLDIIRRTIANPENAERVAMELAKDWNPTILVSPKGEILVADKVVARMNEI